jgi:maltose alpha-D-glucosyltransferase / alpha-amylase
VPPDRLPVLAAAARNWHLWVSSAYLKAYLERCGTSSFIPADREVLALLLQAFLLEKGLYEISYEINHRPDWLRVPLRGLLDLLENPDE